MDEVISFFFSFCVEICLGVTGLGRGFGTGATMRYHERGVVKNDQKALRNLYERPEVRGELLLF